MSDGEPNATNPVKAPFIDELGIEFGDVQPGTVRSRVEVQPKHLQQHGFVHAGVLASLADHTAGACAATLADDPLSVLTIEYKINFLRPAKGPALACTAQAVRAGRRIAVVESRVFQEDGDPDKPVAIAIVTLANGEPGVPPPSVKGLGQSGKSDASTHASKGRALPR